MCFELGKSLYRSENGTSDQFPCFHLERPGGKDFPEDEFLEDVHHFPVVSLAREGLSAEQGPVIVLTNTYSIHLFS